MQERYNRYDKRPHYCGRDIIYDSSKKSLSHMNCKSFACVHCRKKKINSLINKFVRICYINNLQRHMVITLKGKSFRKNVNPDDSFKYMSKKFNNFRWLLKRDYNISLKYISMNRSQYSGYSHLHIMIDKYIKIKYLIDVTKRVGLGSVDIEFIDIHRIKNYLSKYWYKYHEWLIPKGKRHFSTSKDIKLNDKKDYFPEDYYIWIYDEDNIKGILNEYFACVFGDKPPNSYNISQIYS